ncbi:uncharacterized protein TrAFT101_011627 [Trichoderma asperellum]|uniref:Uncharacterized protein n=1 Tax=Trichoderma asperellum (strain ATCC 204424 / CBS 433.97 / NBRC 101777) TaxID=1042311 RepID=A0A2T3Z0D5_TRIA4|nr:hypothetical protein M441DRAFT_82448 [Trichoderma asperellum CBS 433.97]PTB38271.1 hypothetical protein M441DRAFT_82448 [Trichoderma asperellum CBS 433.97]UKZ96850.1 hypothetical protein TrAFT101_011627 [Trichoderma asperellum]
MENHPAAVPDGDVASQIAAEEKAINLAMKRLKLLHIKERQLRNTIPKMLEPLVQKHPSPDIMYAAFMKSVNDAQASIKDFTELMKDDTSKAVFDRADKSKEANPLGIVPWKHKDYPDWFVMDKD